MLFAEKLCTADFFSLNEKKICLIIFEINVRKLSTRSKTEALSIMLLTLFFVNMLPTLFFVKRISNLVSLTVIDSVIFRVAGIIF